MKYGYQKSIKLLWHSNYWDGPISGVCEIDGEKFWFNQFPVSEDGELFVKHINESFDPNDEDSYDYDVVRFYKIYRLPQMTMNDITFNHELFRKYIGHHTDYVNNKRELGAHANCQNNWETYKKEIRQFELKPFLIDSNCIGWFDSHSR